MALCPRPCHLRVLVRECPLVFLCLTAPKPLPAMVNGKAPCHAGLPYDCSRMKISWLAPLPSPGQHAPITLGDLGLSLVYHRRHHTSLTCSTASHADLSAGHVPAQPTISSREAASSGRCVSCIQVIVAGWRWEVRFRGLFYLFCNVKSILYLCIGAGSVFG